MEIESVPFKITDVVKSSIDMFMLKATQKGLSLNYRVSEDIPSVLEGDPTRLRQILINLLGNAMKFTKKGEIVLEVKKTDEHIQNESPYLLFSVKDTGVGISPDNREKIFQSFCQADSSTTRKYGGTGLGLTISMKLVNLMRGRIWVESELGKGSTFSFTINAAVPDKYDTSFTDYNDNLYMKTIEKPPIDKELNMSKIRDVLTMMMQSFQRYNPDEIEPLNHELDNYISNEQLIPIKKSIEELDFIEARCKAIIFAKTLGIDLER
ncbi:MAG: hypothetical protein HQL06_09125 [Nitrospirae bacterium]|nr:hypothetical protein [Nitrospirota bacterium]